MSVYASALARIHHESFGDIGRAAARVFIERMGEPGGLVVELAVGSGVSSRVLLDAGFEVLGVDASASMLELAKGHAPEGRYVQGSLWSFELPPARGVTAFGEAFNYVAEDDVPTVARLQSKLEEVRRLLPEDGLLLFDVTSSTEEGATRGVRFESEDGFLVMEEEERSGELVRLIDTFIPEGELYRRTHEEHRLVLFSPREVERAARQAGFNDVEVLEGYGGEAFQEGWFAVAARP